MTEHVQRGADRRAPPPPQIGRYRVDAVLGRGAMGVIYKAHDPVIERTVAIKLVQSGLLSGSMRDNYLARFQREAQAAGRCLHPNIVTIYDFALHEGDPFLAMEYVEGATLDSAMLQDSLSQDDAVTIMAQVLDALACAHGQGVVHRDIKPANVLLQANGMVKVMDFGISRMEGTGLTQDGSMVGTPSYMSPEQCRGGPVDGRSDLFSAGTLLFEMLTGEKPFPGQSFTEVVTQLLHDEAPDLQDRLGRGGTGLAAVVRQALRKRPDDRFQTAEAMAAALRNARAGQAVAHTVMLPVATIMASQAAARAAAQGPPGLDAEIMGTLQSRLTEHVGPIARLLLNSAVKTADSLEVLCDNLAEKIGSDTARQAFLTAVRRDVSLHASRTGASRPAGSSSPGSSSPGPSSSRAASGASLPARASGTGLREAIPSEAVEHAQAELMRHVGPIARILVKRALPGATSVGDLWTKLAAHVEAPADRAAFLARQLR